MKIGMSSSSRDVSNCPAPNAFVRRLYHAEALWHTVDRTIAMIRDRFGPLGLEGWLCG
jgi:hypothetical protein